MGLSPRGSIQNEIPEERSVCKDKTSKRQRVVEELRAVLLKRFFFPILFFNRLKKEELLFHLIKEINGLRFQVMYVDTITKLLSNVRGNQR